jgi:hypothetical protein
MLGVLGFACFGCNGSASGAGSSACLDDSNGKVGGYFPFDLTVDDSGFSKPLQSENLAQVTLTLINAGTRPHGFQVGCITASAPAGCPTMSCFPAGSTIPPVAPGGTSAPVTFDTPSVEGIYPIKSSEPDDRSVPGLNDGQFILM